VCRDLDAAGFAKYALTVEVKTVRTKINK